MSRRGVPSSFCPHCNQHTYDVFGTCYICKRVKTEALKAAIERVADRAIELAADTLAIQEADAAVRATNNEAAGISQNLEKRGLIAPTEPTEEDKRDRGIELATGSQSAVWVSYALTSVLNVARCKPTFTADDVWADLRENTVNQATNNSAMAGVLRAASSPRFQYGDPAKPIIGPVIEATSESAMSTGKGRHRSRIMVWRSLIYGK